MCVKNYLASTSLKGESDMKNIHESSVPQLQKTQGMLI